MSAIGSRELTAPSGGRGRGTRGGDRGLETRRGRSRLGPPHGSRATTSSGAMRPHTASPLLPSRPRVPVAHLGQELLPQPCIVRVAAPPHGRRGPGVLVLHAPHLHAKV